MIIQDEVKNKVNLEEKADEEKEKDKDGKLVIEPVYELFRDFPRPLPKSKMSKNFPKWCISFPIS